MHGYFYGTFRSQLSVLELKQPNKAERDFRGDEALVFLAAVIGQTWTKTCRWSRSKIGPGLC